MDFRYSPPGFVADLFTQKSADQGNSWFGETQLTFIHQDIDPDEIDHGDTIDVAFQRQDYPRGTICHIRSTDDGTSWGEVTELDLDPSNSHEPKIGYGNDRCYIIWIEDRPNPDTSTYGGLYFSRYDPEPDAIVKNEEIKPGIISKSAYPNPFNPTTTINFNLSNSQNISVKIYNIMGQEVKELFSGFKTAGIVSLVWDGKDIRGEQVSTGVYFCNIRSEDKQQTVKMTVLK